MNVFSLSNLIHYSTEHIPSTVLNTLTPLQKRLMIVAGVVFTALVALCLIAICCDFDAEDLSDDKEIDHKPIVGSHKTTDEKKVEAKIDEAVLDMTEIPECSLLMEEPLLVAEQSDVEEIRQNYLADPEAECKRYLDANLVDSDIIFELASQLIKGQKIPPAVYDSASVVMGRAREFKARFSLTNYVFTHGQSLELSFINDTLHQLIRFFTPAKYNPLAIPFRVPGQVPYTKNSAEFFTKYDLTDLTYQDNHHNLEILSVDALWTNTDPAESAWRHCLWNKNQLQFRNANKSYHLFQSILSWYIKDSFVSDILAEKAWKIASKKNQENSIGVFYTIFIPKSIVEGTDNFTYRSHAYGIRCRCYKEKDIELLERMQNDQSLVCFQKHVTGEGKKNAQYRILTARLSEETQVRSYAFTALSAETEQSYRKQAEKLVREARFYARLIKLNEILPEALVDPILNEMNLLAKENCLDIKCVQHLLKTKGMYLPDRLKETLEMLSS